MTEHIMPCIDHASRTCLRLDVRDGMTLYVPFNLDGLQVKKQQTSKFDSLYKPLTDYGVTKACEHFFRYAKEYGATSEVIEFLGRVLTINSSEADMAKQKLATKEVESKKATKAGKAEKPTKATKEKSNLKLVQPGEKRRSAASAFRELIMEGKLTDDKIFEKVQAEFGLDDSKRSYVKWYRNDLRKGGENPPEPKE